MADDYHIQVVSIRELGWFVFFFKCKANLRIQRKINTKGDQI